MMRTNNLPAEELEKYKIIFESELFNILSYWLKYSLEENGKSFYGAVDLDNQPSGLYYYRIRVDEFSKTNRLLLLR